MMIEVDALHRWAGWEPRSFEHHQVEPVAKAGALRRPGRAPARDAAVNEHEALHARYPSGVTNFGEISMSTVFPLLQTRIARLVCSRAMEPSPRPTFNPAGAGGLLVATTAASIGVGSLIGWAAGHWSYGALGGAVVGVPGGVVTTYRRYRGYFRGS